MSKMYEPEDKKSILKEAKSHGVRATAKAWGISPGTISRWRKAQEQAKGARVRQVHVEPGPVAIPKKTHGRRLIEATLLSYRDDSLTLDEAAEQLENALIAAHKLMK